MEFKEAHMLQRHENFHFLHDLFNLKLSLNPDAFTSNLPVTSGIQCEVDRCERSCSKTLRSDDIVADPLKVFLYFTAGYAYVIIPFVRVVVAELGQILSFFRKWFPINGRM